MIMTISEKVKKMKAESLKRSFESYEKAKAENNLTFIKFSDKKKDSLSSAAIDSLRIIR